MTRLGAIEKIFDYAAAVISVIHDTTFDRLQVVIGLSLHARLLHKCEKDVQTDLKLVFACLCEPCIIGAEDAKGLVSEIFTNHGSHFLLLNFIIEGIATVVFKIFTTDQ